MATGVTTDHVRSKGIEMTERSLDSSGIAMSPPTESATGANGTLGSQEVTCNTLSSQLAGTLNFAHKNGQSISAFPIIVDFRRLIQLSKNSANGSSIIPGVSVKKTWKTTWVCCSNILDRVTCRNKSHECWNTIHGTLSSCTHTHSLKSHLKIYMK